MIQWLQIIQNLIEKGEDLVQATIISQSGSTPRSLGAKMIIRSNGSLKGTIGGGLVEAEVLKMAAEVFKTRQAQIKKVDLTGVSAATVDRMICGGHLEVLLEWVPADPVTIQESRDFIECLQKEPKGYLVKSWESGRLEFSQVKRSLIQKGEVVAGRFPGPPSWGSIITARTVQERFPLLLTIEGQSFFVEPTIPPSTVFLLGAGHVSQQVAEVTALVGFRVVVLDDRPEFANRARFPKADQIIVIPSFERAFQNLEINSDSYIVIVTRGHVHDKTVLGQALRRKAGYIGMIGSIRKRDLVYQTLLTEDFTTEDLKRVHCPIGLNIGGETPEEIAVSITAELIQVRAEKSKS